MTDDTFCMTIITALGSAVLGLAAAFRWLLTKYMAAMEHRVSDSKEVRKILEANEDETRVQ